MLHKEINSWIKQESKSEEAKSITGTDTTKIENIDDAVKSEIEKELRKEYDLKLEELNKKHSEEITEIKRKYETDWEIHEKEKKEWIDQRNELEQEFNRIKNKQENDHINLKEISYKVNN